MANVQNVLRAELDPRNPVPEIMAVVRAMLSHHPGNEEAILKGVDEVINLRLNQLKGAADHGQSIRNPERSE